MTAHASSMARVWSRAWLPCAVWTGSSRGSGEMQLGEIFQVGRKFLLAGLPVLALWTMLPGRARAACGENTSVPGTLWATCGISLWTLVVSELLLLKPQRIVPSGWSMPLEARAARPTTSIWHRPRISWAYGAAY